MLPHPCINEQHKFDTLRHMCLYKCEELSYRIQCYIFTCVCIHIYVRTYKQCTPMEIKLRGRYFGGSWGWDYKYKIDMIIIYCICIWNYQSIKIFYFREPCWACTAINWLWNSWPCFSLDTAARKLVPTPRRAGPIPHHGRGELTLMARGGELALPLIWGEATPMAWTDQLNYHLGPQLCLDLSHPNIYPI